MLKKLNLPKILVESALNLVLFAIVVYLFMASGLVNTLSELSKEGYALNISIIFLPICMIIYITVKFFELIVKKK